MPKKLNIGKTGSILCPKCQKNPAGQHEIYGVIWCRDCRRPRRKMTPYPEFVPDRIKDDRKKHFKGLLQPFRSGELSREYVETYPDRVNTMLKEGTVTHKQVRKAKNIWRDLKGYQTWKKSY